MPNQSVERTGMSRSAQRQFQRQRRLIPVAHLWRSAAKIREASNNMNHLIATHEELWNLWEKSRSLYEGVAPKDRYSETHLLVCRMFPMDRHPGQIADRFFSLMVCIDSSQYDLDKDALGAYGQERFMISREVILKLWNYFGDTSRSIDPRNVVRACEIV